MSRHRPRGRGGLRHVARALQSYKKLRHPQGGRRAEREQTLPRREQADKNRDHPAKNIRPRHPFGRRQQPFGSLKTGDAPPKAALPGLRQGRFSLHRAAAEAPRATPRRHAPGSHPPGATPPAGGKKAPAGGRQRQKSGPRLCPFAGFMYICNAATRGPRQPRGRHGPRGCCRLTTKNISR